MNEELLTPGIRCVDHLRFAVRDLQKRRPLYEERFGFLPVAHTSAAGMASRGERSVLYSMGKQRIVLSEPIREDSDVARYLSAHAEGVMTIAFEVEDATRAHAFLMKRGATPVSDITRADGYAEFDIIGPIGGVRFRFIERRGEAFAPGFDPRPSAAEQLPGVQCEGIDHIAINCLSVRPIATWLCEVLGMSMKFEGQLSTDDRGVRWGIVSDPTSGIRFANNEPLLPSFWESQIARFVLANGGPGIQHVAFNVPNIIEVSERHLRTGMATLAQTASYYEDILDKTRSAGFDSSKLRESLSDLRARNILLDGSEEGYVLQLLQPELRDLERDPSAGPFFFEFVQRCGKNDFGYQGIRAAFEAIERGSDAASSSTVPQIGMAIDTN